MPEHLVSLPELIKYTGLNSRYVIYLIGSSVLGAVAGLCLPTTGVPPFRWNAYFAGGCCSDETRSSASFPTENVLLVSRALGWALVAPLADIVGRKKAVTMSLRKSLVLAALIVVLPGDVSMLAAIVLYQIMAPGWEANAALLQAETAAQQVVIPLSIIEFGSTAFALSIWIVCWLGLWDLGHIATPWIASNEGLNERMTFGICAGLLSLGYLFFKYVAYDSPFHLVLLDPSKQKAAWQTLRAYCRSEAIYEYLSNAQVNYMRNGRSDSTLCLVPDDGDEDCAYLRTRANLLRKFRTHLRKVYTKNVKNLYVIGGLAVTSCVSISANLWTARFWSHHTNHPTGQFWLDAATLPGAVLSYMLAAYVGQLESDVSYVTSIESPLTPLTSASDMMGPDHLHQWRISLSLGVTMSLASALVALFGGGYKLLVLLASVAMLSITTAIDVAANAAIINWCPISTRAACFGAAKATSLLAYIALKYMGLPFAYVPLTWAAGYAIVLLKIFSAR